MDARAVALIVATFLDAFEHVVLFAGQNRDLLLAGSRNRSTSLASGPASGKSPRSPPTSPPWVWRDPRTSWRPS